MLAKILFKAFGIDVSVGTILKILAVLAAIAALWFLIIKPVQDHFKKYDDTMQENIRLEDDLKTSQDDLKEAVRINGENAKLFKTALEQEQAATAIAKQEAVDAAKRQTRYKGIKDEIAATPEADRTAVDPVIARTIDRLWE